MGQFKPMVKMETTEPSIELKLKKGGSVAHKKMKTDTSSGHKPMKKMMDGGIMGALASTPALVKGPVATPKARVPGKPSLALRRRAMAKGLRPFKEGGESAAEHKAEMKKINKVESELKSHEGKKASTAHKGLKSGGKCYANGGIIKSESGKTKMVTAENGDRSPAKTGDVKLGNSGGYKTGGVVKGNGGGYATGGVALGNAGGFKKGGKASKKAFASGGSVNDAGKAASMPQGNKKPSSPVSINKLSGTFKKGGNVSSKKLQNVFKNENAPAVKASKAKTDLVYSPYQKAKKFADGGTVDLGTQDTDMTDGGIPTDPIGNEIYDVVSDVTDVVNPVMYATGANSGRPYDPSFNPMIQRGNPKIRPQEPPKDLKVKSNRPGRPIVVQPGPNVFPRPNQSIPKNPMGLTTKDQYKMFYNADGTRRPMVKKGGRVKK